jgi:hypothetical protein
MMGGSLQLEKKEKVRVVNLFTGEIVDPRFHGKSSRAAN